MDEDENSYGHDVLPLAEAIAEIEEEIGHSTSPTDNEKDWKAIEDKLEEEYKAIEEAKEDLAREERAQMGRMVEIMELKKQLARKLAECRKTETTTLPAKREAVKNMDKEHYEKLKKNEDAQIAERKQANKERLARFTGEGPQI